jgi:hypothetical protein
MLSASTRVPGNPLASIKVAKIPWKWKFSKIFQRSVVFNGLMHTEDASQLLWTPAPTTIFRVLARKIFLEKEQMRALPSQAACAHAMHNALLRRASGGPGPFSPKRLARPGRHAFIPTLCTTSSQTNQTFTNHTQCAQQNRHNVWIWTYRGILYDFRRTERRTALYEFNSAFLYVLVRHRVRLNRQN